MLVIDRPTTRMGRGGHDDSGAVLVTVVVVIFVGFIIAATIAASVVFTIGANVDNKDRTQAFIAAESGRDVAIASLRSAIGPTGIPSPCPVALSAVSASGAQPHYAYSIRIADDGDDTVSAYPTAPAGWDASGLTDACPTATTEWVVIRTTGTGIDDAEATIDSVYPWYHGPATQPAGTLAFFEGKFTATKTTYTGDLVIRTGNYTCNNGAGNEIDGDLWVLNGGLEVSSDCIITGSVYTRGLIDVKNNQFKVGHDVVSLEGSIYLTADAVDIGGDVHAGAKINTKNGDGVVGGSFKAVGGMDEHTPTDWERPDGSPVPTPSGQTTPVITPTLDQVFDATTWIELTSTSTWSSATDPIDPSSPYTGQCSDTDLKSILEAGGPRAVIDMSGCGGNAIDLDLNVPTGITLARDVLIYVPSNAKMDLHLDGAITKPTGTDPQLFIVHLDANGADDKPTCTEGSDSFTAGTGVSVRTMIYSACGIPNTVSLTMEGQFYMGNDGLHLNNGSAFTCKPMSWKPTLSGLSCGVKGTGGIFDPTNTVTLLENLKFQTER
jgi:hypothetical protein